RERRIVLSTTEDLASAPAAEAEAAALLAVHGLVPRGALSPALLGGLVTEEEAGSWIDGMGAACGLAAAHRASRAGAHRRATAAKEGSADEERAEPSPLDEDLPEAGTTAAALARRLVDRLGWKGRVDLF